VAPPIPADIGASIAEIAKDFVSELRPVQRRTASIRRMRQLLLSTSLLDQKFFHSNFNQLMALR
jgi:hypothetical protein